MSEILITFVNTLATVLFIAMIGRVVMSWVNVGRSNSFYPIASIIYQITEPILAPLRKILPKFGMLDFSPMVALILIRIVQSILKSAL